MYEPTNPTTIAPVTAVDTSSGTREPRTRFSFFGSVRASSTSAVAAFSRVIHGSASASSGFGGGEQSRYARLRRSRLSGPEPAHGTLDSEGVWATTKGRAHGAVLRPKVRLIRAAET